MKFIAVFCLVENVERIQSNVQQDVDESRQGVSFVLVCFYIIMSIHVIVTVTYFTLRGRDQRLKCAFISIFYGAVLY